MVSDFSLRYVNTGETFNGGTGEVVICNDKHLDRKVAIKFIKSDENRARLQDEVKALQQICSKHVVQIFDIVFCETTRRFGIVQEFVPGKDLDDIVDAGISDKEQYLKILYQISSGLTDIHKQGLIHRDIKLNNIKFNEENIIKIFDFGLAKSSISEASTLGFVGTPYFAAPELYQSGTVLFTKAVDVYAFGIIAWLISGINLPAALLETPPKGHKGLLNFGSLMYGLGDEISQTLNSTLSENPSDRPSMMSIAKLFEKYLLRGRHRAIVVSGGQVYKLAGGNQNRSVTLRSQGLGLIKIDYDGLDFKVAEVKGNAYVNNQTIIKNYALPPSCVITLGDGEQRRLFITFDISNPEVVL